MVASPYAKGHWGPWLFDDDQMLFDGWDLNGRIGPGPTFDGLDIGGGHIRWYIQWYHKQGQRINSAKSRFGQ